MDKIIVFLDGARTPFGKFGGGLKDLSATDLGVLAAKEAVKRSKVDSGEFGHVVFGNALQTSSDAIYLARHVGLKSGLSVQTPAVTVNRLCGSGFQAVVDAAKLLMMEEALFVLAGGTESMSQAPHVIWGGRWGIPLGKGKLVDLLWDALYDPVAGCSMAITAENLAEKNKITREEADEFAFRSQQLAKSAIEQGKLKEEIVPVQAGKKWISQDEHPRFDTTLEGLGQLTPYFKNDGTVTAGNASGICDGAAALVLSTEETAKKKNLPILGKLLGWGYSGVDPKIMGIGPVEASRAALKKAGLSIQNLDLIEVNEAFAPQYLAVEKELGLQREKVNVNGGAIALGHPLAASGARITLTLLYELRRSRKKYGLGTACIGGGQGIAVIVESC
jgi:acetyl-CoA acetyltransferase family protein